jgi:AraC-like DNA-binding protein
VDPLSDLLTVLNVQRFTTLRFESSGAYAFRFGAHEHVKFGAVLAGRLRLWIEGDAEPVCLEPGDCYLQINGGPYRTATTDDAPEVDGNAFFAGVPRSDGTVRLGDGPPDRIVIGGRFIFDDEGASWLRAALPPIIHIKAASPAAAPLRATLALLGAEAGGGGPGEAVVVDRLADVLLVQAIRAHLVSSAPQHANWLAGLADPRIGNAMRRFHADVAADWTVSTLAAAAGMSRSSFAERFRARVGMAPLDYVTRWRMVRVRRALIDSDLAFATIAARNGYRSRSSCSQSFKRMFGYSPYEVRNGAAAEASDGEGQAPN